MSEWKTERLTEIKKVGGRDRETDRDRGGGSGRQRD